MPLTMCSSKGHRAGRPCAALLLALAGGAAAAVPFPGGPVTTPDDAGTVLLTLDASAATPQMERLRQRLKGDPRNLTAATELARRYLQLASRHGDPRYAGWARATLAPWWAMERPPLDVLVLRARYRQHRHAFAGAANDLAQATARAPGRTDAWLLKAGVHRVRGEREAAAASCRNLARATRDQVTAMLCRADVELLTDAAGDVARRLRAAVVRPERLPPWQRDWAHLLLAEAERMRGDPAAALEALDAVTDPNVYTRALRADLLLARGQPAAAAELLAPHRQADSLLLRYAEALKAQGDPSWREAGAALAQRFEAADRRGDSPRHWRERARAALVLDEAPGRAVELARRSWQSQRELADARLLARAAAAAGSASTLAVIDRWRQAHGVDDRVLDSALDQPTGAGGQP